MKNPESRLQLNGTTHGEEGTDARDFAVKSTRPRSYRAREPLHKPPESRDIERSRNLPFLSGE
jgi:hypothetical protein